MPRSLRARLLVWYTLIMAVTIAALTGAVCYELWRSRVAEVDRGLYADASALAGGLQPAPGGDFDLDVPVHMRPQEDIDAPAAVTYAIWTAGGDLIDRFPADMDVTAPGAEGLRTRDGRRELASATPSGAVVVVGRDLADVRRDVVAFARMAALTGVGALGVALAGGWLLVGRALTPLTRISRTASSMAAGKLDARIAIEGTDDELEQVAVVLNDAFDRLHLAVESQRQFTADASHELRTPLATISAESDWALLRERSPEEYRGSLDTCRRAAARMNRVVERLLTLARADAGAIQIERTAVPLDTVVEDVLAMIRPLAARKGVTVEVRLDAAAVIGDRDGLLDLVTNICSNAVEYNRDGGSVRVDLRIEGEEAVLRVSDTGIGITPEDLPHVFDRFFRTDRSRTASSGGAGLGLTIARSIAEAHGGTITCESTPGEGTEVVVRLPSTY